MKVRILLTAAALAIVPAVVLAGPSLTLYTSDLGLVKESRALDFRGSRDTLRLEGVSSRLDASSLRLLPSSGRLARLAYRFDVATGDGLLERAIGSRVRVVSKTNERVTEGTLLSADGAWLVVRGDDGALSTLSREAMQEIRLAKPDASLSLKPAIEAVVDGAKKGGGSVELQYLTGGLSWSAEHTLVRTGETSAQWSAVVRVENTTGRDYRDASVKLIAGEVSRAGAPMPVAAREMKFSTAMAPAAAAPVEQAFSDFHLYTLPGVVTLRDRESQTLVLLEPKTVAVKPLYVYRGGNASGVQWKLEMVNSAKDGTGAPIPAGRVRCYAPDADKDLQLTGETTVKHTAVDEKVTLEMGYAFDLAAERKQVSERRVSDREREYSVEIRLRNRKAVDATIQVEEPANGETDVVKSSIPVTRDEANLLKWSVMVAAGKEVVLTYTVRQRW
jgi:hypothetical protein